MSVTVHTTFHNSGDTSLSAPLDEVGGGSGGDNLPFWSLSREEKLIAISGVSYEDYSSYPPPVGVVSEGFHASEFEQDVGLGIQARGQTTSADGEGLSGEASIYHTTTGTELLSKTVGGPFSLVAPPPRGVPGGESVDVALTTADMSVKFAPSFAGLAYESPDLDKYHEISYSGVEGTVTDATGSPVADSALLGTGDAATTDAEGYYTLLAPVGTETSLQGLKKTKTKTATPPSGDKATLDWAFAGITIRVQTPYNYEPVPGAPVEIDGTTFETDASGEVVYPTAGLGTEHSVRVFDSDDFTDTVVAPTTEGQMTVVRVGPGSSSFGDSGDSDATTATRAIEVTVRDAGTGDAVRDVAVSAPDHGVTSWTKGNGETRLVIPNAESGSVRVVAGGESRRYDSSEATVDISGEDLSELTLTLSPSNFTTQV